MLTKTEDLVFWIPIPSLAEFTLTYHLLHYLMETRREEILMNSNICFEDFFVTE